MFHGVGTDVRGNEVDFTVPMMFVSIADAKVQAKLEQVLAVYNASGTADDLAFRELVVPGQQVAFAEAGQGELTTQLVTERLNFVVDPKTNKPRLLKADVHIPQVEELLGTNAPTTIRLYQPYVDGVSTATGVFAEIAKPDYTKLAANPLTGMVESALEVKFTSDKAGGFATPNLGVSTLSRALGPLAGDAGDAAAGTFDPTSFFPKDLAMLFGSFDLGLLLVGNDLEKNAPKLRTTTAAGKVLTKIDWSPEVQTKDLVVVKFEKDQGGTTKLEVTGFIEKPIGSAEPSFEFKGTLNAFKISVLKSVDVNFDTFTFVSRNGQKPDVDVQLQDDPIQFGGDLAFVEDLRKAIPPGLFGDGPSLDVTANGIRAGFAFDLPPVAVGVFALKDVSLGAALTLPFTDGKPVFDFNVSTREHPFVLAVTIFGGGGFFHLQLDTSGMKELEAAFEFGVTAAIDLGVAGGSVHMMAGIYFSLKQVEPDDKLAARLGGYLRMGGSLRVLALITVSVEFNLSFTYDSATDKAYGRATLTVEVDVTLFSVSVELTVERAFGGSGDPSFRQSFESASVWKRYAEAFA